MDSQTPPKKLTAVLALLIVAMGGAYILFAAGIIAPGHQHLTDGERWFTIAFGSTFLLGGIARNHPTGCRRRRRDHGRTAGRYAILASLDLWSDRGCHCDVDGLDVQLGGVRPRRAQFTSSLPFTGETGGRIAFGIGALLMWLALAVIGFIKARRLLQRR